LICEVRCKGEVRWRRGRVRERRRERREGSEGAE